MAQLKRVNNIGLYKLAERMFVEEGMSCKAIAEALSPKGPTEQTLGSWRKGIQGDQCWDEKRTSFLATPHNIKKVVMAELEKLSNGHEASIDIKAIKEAVQVIDSLSDKVSTQITFAVFKEFDNWMAEQDPEMAISFLEWHKLFLLHKAQNEQ